jgi:cell division protein FtsQ
LRSLGELLAPRRPAPAFAAPQAPRVLLRRERQELLRSAAPWALRFTRPAPRGVGALLAVALLLAVAVASAAWGGEYHAFVVREGSVRDYLARAFGFDIAIVTISGEAELREPEILSIAGVTPRNSLLFLDVAEARAKLEATPLVKRASVRKLYPDHLVIDLVERAPYALWQKDGKVDIVAADGAPIDEMHDLRFAGLPFVVGEGANDRLPEFMSLLDAAGELRTKIRAGVLIGDRRWNLKMASGVDVKLPEENPRAAVEALVQLQRDSRILDRDILSLDLRIPGRVYARLSEDAAAARADAHPAKKGGAT